MHGAPSRIRTYTLKAADSRSAASTSFAMRASWVGGPPAPHWLPRSDSNRQFASLGGPRPSHRQGNRLACPNRVELLPAGLEDQRPRFRRRAYVEQRLGVEPNSDFVGDEISHHAPLRIFESRDAELIRGPSPYSFRVMAAGTAAAREVVLADGVEPPANALSRRCSTTELRKRRWSLRKESNLFVLAPKASGQPMTHTEIEWTSRLDLNQRGQGCSLPPRLSATGLSRFVFDHHRTGAPSRNRTYTPEGTEV